MVHKELFIVLPVVSLVLSGFTSKLAAAQGSGNQLGWIGVLIVLLLLIPVVIWLMRSSGTTAADRSHASSESPAPAYPVSADALTPAPIEPAPVTVEDVADGAKEVIENVVEQIADTAADGADEVEAIAPQAGKIEPNLSTEADAEATMPHLVAGAGETRAPRRAQAEPAKPDDLVIIEGIGPKIASLLQGAGINTFAHLATTEVGQIRQILQEAGLANIADPATWPEQAQLAADGNWEALKSLQENLKAGRRA